MKTKIFMILVGLLLIVNLSFIGAESFSIQQASVNFVEYEQGTIYFNPVEVNYNEEFTLEKGQKVIIPGRYFITLNSIGYNCVANGKCYLEVKLWYHTIYNTFRMREGDTKKFVEESILKLLKLENNKATFIVYQTVCKEGEVEYYDCGDGFKSNLWIKRKCKNGKWYDYAHLDLCNCEKNSFKITSDSACKEGYSCVNRKCMRTTYTASITGAVIKINKECEGCLLNNECLPIGYRTNDKYCDAGEIMKNQKQEDKSCNNNFECKSNICVSGKCVSGGLIQGILDFFKRLFGL